MLDPEVLGLDVELVRFDLSLESRRRTENAVCSEAAEAMAEAGLGLRPRRSRPRAPMTSAAPTAILREAIDGTVIVRTGRRIPG